MGCGSRGLDDAESIVYWRTLTGRAGDAQDELVERFNREHGPLKARVDFQGGYGDLASKLMAAVVAERGPDVTQLGTFEIRQFARARALVDLRPYVEGDIGLDTSDWPDTLLSAGEVDDGIYWLPFNVTVPVLYYNAEHFARAGLDGPPETWAEFYDYARRLTVEGEHAGLALWDITWPIVSAIWSEAGELTNADYSEITLNHPVAIEVLESFQALVQEGAVVLPAKATGGHRAAFLSGKASMILDSPAAYNDIIAHAEGFTPIATLYPAGSSGRVFAPGGGGLAMLSLTPPERRDAAWAFIRFMLAPEQLAHYAEQSGYMAFSGAALEASSAIQEDPQRLAIHDALQFVRADFSLTNSPALRNAFDEAFQKIMIEGTNVTTTLNEADARAERDVQRER